MSTEEMPLVVAAEDMSDEHLILHLNNRHPDVWPNFQYRLRPEGNIRPFALAYRHLWAALHGRLHRGGVEHVHEPH